jgi:hypothetical protein
MNVVITPATRYFEPPLPFRGSARVTVPAARHDAIDVEVAPASCAGTTVYSVARYEGPQSIANPQASRFYPNHVPRKTTVRNELYDVSTDPLMLRNVLDPAGEPEMNRRLRETFERATAGRRRVTHAVTDEEKQKLKSLGYIQ